MGRGAHLQSHCWRLLPLSTGDEAARRGGRTYAMPPLLDASLYEGEETMTRTILPWFAALLVLGGLLSLAVEAQSQPLRQLVVVGTVVGDGALHGVLTITGLALNETGQLVATGTLAGTAGTPGSQRNRTSTAPQRLQKGGHP